MQINQVFKCLLCCRDKFTRPSPHRCIGGFRKRKLVWENITPKTNKVKCPFCNKNNAGYVEDLNEVISCPDCLSWWSAFS